MPKILHSLLALTLACALPAFAQEDEAPPPPPKEGVTITFVPPPMRGVLSLGVYDGSGKLVRTLHREATDKNFRKGINGFITQWDGRDDGGRKLPNGNYHAKGWMVGDLDVEGVAFHGNEWLKDEKSPRFARVLSVQAAGPDEVRVVFRALDGAEHTHGWKLAKEGEQASDGGVQAALDEGKLIVRNGDAVTPVMLGEGEKAVACSVGKGGVAWVIVEGPGGQDGVPPNGEGAETAAKAREVRAYSGTGEFLRRLAYGKDEPAPRQIVASQWSESIFLFEESATDQRVRALALETPAGEGTPAWKTIYQKRIHFTDTFEAAATALGRATAPKPAETVKLQTKANALLGGVKTEIVIKVTADAHGSLLSTADGLPLTYLTDTTGLKWAALVQEKEGLFLFEGDGAVVGEYRIKKPSTFMAFDAGEYELTK